MYSQIGTLLDYIMKISPGPNKSQIAIRCVEINKLIDEHMQLIKHQSVDYNVLNLVILIDIKPVLYVKPKPQIHIRITCIPKLPTIGGLCNTTFQEARI